MRQHNISVTGSSTADHSPLLTSFKHHLSAWQDVGIRKFCFLSASRRARHTVSPQCRVSLTEWSGCSHYRSAVEGVLWLVSIALKESKSSWAALSPGCRDSAPAKFCDGNAMTDIKMAQAENATKKNYNKKKQQEKLCWVCGCTIQILPRSPCGLLHCCCSLWQRGTLKMVRGLRRRERKTWPMAGLYPQSKWTQR